MAELLTKSMKTLVAKPGEITQRWYLVDADGLVLGRLAAEVAKVLRGKHKPIFTPHVDCGDGVIVVNASRVRLTGRKAEQKTYFRHSGYMGGGKLIPFKRMLERRPEFVIRHAVRGMLPKTTLGRQMLKKLRVYAGPEHPHKGLATEPLEIRS
jgi:large subunit ribosomal protein L13